ncbi:membrane hypothetical protein [Bradyrhizobium sp. ORS 375]|uniref:hypothetical protein n=1 Tax=Bradyrhizobium sp. (strain ORS 375) TaxID=566679 RepID=UPI0002407A9E|nr:hypothetical protein [Bradyrhizobium sp. ORS 375]CCD95192.1 membrane hypothetical protein [Bradyrhizobium sp. ORS 375]
MPNDDQVEPNPPANLGDPQRQGAGAAGPNDGQTKREGPTSSNGGSGEAQILQTLLARSVDFSKSGLFFILLGCGFLYCAYELLYHVHPTFVFILALLGLSIVLFGTGTQSLGSGEFAEPGSKAKAKVYLAGGAGLLAGLFGFGAVLGSDKIERVFANSSGYALVVFEISNPNGIKLQQASVLTHLRDGRQLPVLIRDQSIEVLAPISRGYGKLDVCIEAKGLEQKWSIEHGCPTLDLKDNAPGQRSEPVQSIGIAKLDLKYVNTTGLDEAGKPTAASAFVAK